MRTTTSSKLVAHVFGILAVLLACVVVTHGEITTLGSATALSQGRTYSLDSDVTYIPDGETGLTVAFSAGSYPPGAQSRGMMLIDEAVEGSPFKGDFIAAAINAISYTVAGDGSQPALAQLRLKSTKRLWLRDFDVSATAGEQTVVVIPLALSAGWHTTAAGDKDAMLAEDLQDVVSLAIELAPGKTQEETSIPAQSYTINEFVVINDDGISSPPATLTPLERSLTARFGYGYGSVNSLTDVMKTWDQDSDGMVDYVEIWSENDQSFANSIFAAEDISVDDDGVSITWTTVAGQEYTVLRADALGDGFSPVSVLTRIVATETGFMTREDSSAPSGAASYYRILKH